MLKAITLHEGVVRPSLVAALEAFRAPDHLVSSYYLNLDPPSAATREAVQLVVKNTLAQARERIDQLDAASAVRNALRRDWELVQELMPTATGERHTRSLACFVASDASYGRALRLPWRVRDRTFFEDRFVLWPLRQILDQADRFGIILTDKETARLFLFFMEQIEEVTGIMDDVPGRVRFPDPFGESHYVHKHVEHFHHHFERVSEVGLRLFEWEPFAHLIIGGRWETLPQFESRLHRYLRDRIVTRWEIDVHTLLPQIRERVLQEEQKVLERQAQSIWKAIQDDRPHRGALGLEETVAALWQRRVQSLLVDPRGTRPGFRCSVCSRLHLINGACFECGGKVADVPDVFEEAIHDAVEQSAQVRYWQDPALHQVNSIAALKRF
jgi:peptide subunit release factor 1 (eRF1)